MNRKQRVRARTLRRSALLIGAISVGMAFAWTQAALTARMLDRAQTRTPVLAAALKVPVSKDPPPDEIVEPAAPVVIQADATQTSPEDPAAFRALCDAFSAASGQPAPLSEMPVSASAPAENDGADNGPNWFAWGRMGTERSVVTLPLALPDDSLRVYAVHSAQGASVCVVNRSEQKVPIRLQLRLPRGVYKWERLSFAPPLPPEDRGALHPTAWREAGRNAPLAAHLGRLQSVELAEAATVVKPGQLQPGELCLYRCTDVSREARAAVYETRNRLQEMARTAPDSARRLRRILDEGGDFLDYVCAGSGGTRDRRIGGIHHLMLVTSQAHSLHHNFQQRHTVSVEAGAATMGALERLTDGLAETSAAILGLVPQIEVEADAVPASGPPADARAPASLVTVSIANTGPRSVEAVKIGLDASALPAGTRCDPEDPAYFGTLHPGQTVRATFHLRIPSALPVPANRCVGDVSYFVAVAPAHLRPRPW